MSKYHREDRVVVLALIEMEVVCCLRNLQPVTLTRTQSTTFAQCSRVRSQALTDASWLDEMH
jgi:hypothetical protein